VGGAVFLIVAGCGVLLVSGPTWLLLIGSVCCRGSCPCSSIHLFSVSVVVLCLLLPCILI